MQSVSPSKNPPPGRSPAGLLPIQLCPAHKQVIEHEARRRGADPVAMVNMGLAKLTESIARAEGQGKVPDLTICTHLLDIAESMEKAARDRKTSLSLQLEMRICNLRLRRADVLLDRRDRRQLLKEAIRQSRTERMWIPLSSEERRCLRQASSRKKTAVRPLLRNATLSAIQAESKLGVLDRWTRQWVQRLESLHQKHAASNPESGRSSSSDSKPASGGESDERQRAWKAVGKLGKTISRAASNLFLS